ncbi:hypothetical protein M0804_013731 [Polistes exclamans]|nr:hypothetical protein M0804_013731 [Polistes exclamans]
MNKSEAGTESNKSFKFAQPESGEEVVISGIAGRFAESNNVEELKNNLFNRKDCITDDFRRWKSDNLEIPQRTGKISNIQKFDALFFGIHSKQAHAMDPMSRMLLEHSYEAIIDAGINPQDLSGRKTGVFIGVGFCESEKTFFYDDSMINGFGIIGCNKATWANRISFCLNITGPSYNVEAACSSSLHAIEHAYRAIRSGQCDDAIVGGSNLCLNPNISLQFSRLGVLSKDGRCKCFDQDATGFARSEAVVVAFLQKAKNAKRIYATICHAKTNCDGYKEEGMTFPSSGLQSTLFRELYNECGVSTTSVSYIEAHCTGTVIGDREEINAIDNIFTTNRTNPLKIGSLKSNLGHAESASGMCSIVKAIISMESCLIPPNINFNRPRKDIKALTEGRIKVVTEITPLDSEYIGINSFGVGGTNAHVLLKSNPKKKVNNGLPNDDLPRLVVVSGRTEEAVIAILNDIKNRPIDVEYIRLLHDIYLKNIPKHLYRGYTITGLQKFNKKIKEIEHFSGMKRPICFVFSGMGSQSLGMGKALMKFPIFAKALQKCDEVLKPYKLNIYKILTENDETIFDNILHSFVGISAFQIGLVDLLTSVGVVPDYIIGHSFGELGCAYADGCLTAAEMILAAYWRGIVSIEEKILHGSMTAVGLGYKDIQKLCPPDIDEMNIFVQEVSCCNIPYHSRYVEAAGKKLLTYLENAIPVAKSRSKKWLSTSVPRNEWSSSAAEFSSSEYYANNFMKPVLFEETLDLIPNNAVTIEIAPHGLLQVILEESLQPTVTNIVLNQRDHEDNLTVFLQGLGKLYNTGLQLDLSKLYPHVEYPVSRGTPMISPLIRWEHSYDWFVTSYKMKEKINSGDRMIEISILDENFQYIQGHMLDGRNLFPTAGYLCLVWETMGMNIGQLYTEVSVIFEDVKIIRATNIPKEDTVEMTVMIQKGSGKFEIIENNDVIVTGIISIAKNLSKEKVFLDLIKDNNDEEEEELNAEDIYKELVLRGYQYSGIFRSMQSASISISKGHVEWKNNWVAFIDSITHIKILSLNTRDLLVPIGIRKLVIDIETHQKYLENITNDKQYVPVRFFKQIDVIIAGGIEISNIRLHTMARKRPTDHPVIEEYKFIAYRDKKEMSLRKVLTLSMQITLENIPVNKVKTIELVENNDNISAEELVSPMLSDILSKLPSIQANVNVLAPTNKFDKEDIPEKIIVTKLNNKESNSSSLLAVGSCLLTKEKKNSLKKLLQLTIYGAFILSREKTSTPLDLSILQEFQLGIVLEKRTSKESWILLRKIQNIPQNTFFINVNSNEFNWLKQVQTILANKTKRIINDTRVILVEENNFESGLLGFINCLRKEPGGEIFRALLIQDNNAPKFSSELSLYSKQLKTDLIMNVLRPGNIYGSYRHQLLPPWEPKPVYHALIDQLFHGDLSSMRWIEGPITKDYQKEDLVNIYYASLNFKDVLLATGKLSSLVENRKEIYKEIGFEYSGISFNGRRIMGINRNRCLSNICQLNEIFSWIIPESWSLEDAATVPSVYCTSVAALYTYGKMKKGDKVLIHAGSGGVGQAAINLALYEGCEVFTTVGTIEKRKFIKQTFPSIDDYHIGTSRDTSFEQLVLQQTDGAGVDIVLNSLADEKRLASLRCLARGGRFLEIGKFDFIADIPLSIEFFMKEISFHVIMLDTIMTSFETVKNEISSEFSKLLKENAIKPLNRTVFGKDQVETALRYMAAGKHIGKVLIKIQEEKEPMIRQILAEPSYMCFPNKSYIIFGGLGGFGLELIDWLILRNAQNIIIISRNGVKTGYQRMRINIWESYGVNIKILVGLDAARREDCELIVKTAIDEGPVDGVFNLAASLEDRICRNHTVDSFQEPFKGKAWATKSLDEVTRELCPNLRHFVVFSSVSCGRGNGGQTNYGMANSIMERICEKRMKDGFPGLAIQLGPIKDVGIIADMQKNDRKPLLAGIQQQDVALCLQELNRILLQSKPIVSMIIPEKQVINDNVNNIVDTILNIMNIKDLKSISKYTSLVELGMDSIMVVEIKQTLQREFQIYLTTQNIRSLNFAKLMDMTT